MRGRACVFQRRTRTRRPSASAVEAMVQQAIDAWGFIPEQWTRHGGLTIITSMFLHGGIIHLLGNLYFLLIFGDNVEDEFGHGGYLALIAAAGLSALCLHSLFDLRSGIPCVGASGFISGIIAAYAFCFPKVRLAFMICRRNYVLPFSLYRCLMAVPAWGVFAIWIAFQILAAMATRHAAGGGVAYLAHLGGVLPGIIFALGYRYRQQKSYQSWAAEQTDAE